MDYAVRYQGGYHSIMNGRSLSKGVHYHHYHDNEILVIMITE